jgi:predicted Rdx family selenoprotein
MTEKDEDDTASAQRRDDAGLPQDDERRSKQRIEQTGEPDRDALGNQDGSS